MQDYVNYIETTFQGETDNGTLYRYKRQLLDRMSARAAEITHAGLRDEKVLYDLVISEFPDLPGDYRRFCEKDRLKRRDKYFNRLMMIGTPIVAIACVLVFLAIGFVTQKWSPAWVLVPDGILIWVIFLLSEGIRRITRQRRLFHPIARIMLALSVMCATVCVFLIAMAALHLPDAWMQCRVPERGQDIFGTLQYVKQSVNQFKHDKFMGLYGLPLLKLGYSIMPHAASEEIIKIGYSNPLVAMSNIGILDEKALSLCGNEPTDGFMTGAVKYKPFVLLSANTMRNVVTLSMCVRGNEEDKQIVEHFFDLMERNLDTLISE